MTTTLDEKKIDEIFEQHDNQIDVLFALYREVYPNWDEISKLDGYVSITKRGWEYICEKFIEFDRKHHPDVLAGGLWMNSGFSVIHQFNVIPCGYITTKGEHISQKA